MKNKLSFLRRNTRFGLLLFILLPMGIVNTYAQAPFGNTKDSLTTEQIKEVVNKQFSSLVTSDAKTTMGSGINLKIENDADLSFTAHSVFDNGSVLTVKGNGAVSDGVFAVFNNSKLNSKIGLNLKYSFLSNKKKIVVRYNYSALAAMQKKQQEILDEQAAKRFELEHNPERSLLELKKEKYRRIDSTLTAQIALLNKNNTMLYQQVMDSMAYEKVKNQKLMTDTEDAITNIKPKAIRGEQIDNAAAIKWNDIELPELTGFRMGWLSVSYGVSSNSFKWFKPSLTYPDQVFNQEFVSHEACLQYSVYRYLNDAFASRYFDAGVGLTYSDNFSELSKKEISETTEHGANPQQRTTVKKYAVYTGDYQKHLLGTRLYADYYQFLFSNNTFALTASPELIVKRGEFPVSNFTLGTMFVLKDEVKDKSVVNIGLYYQFIDMFNVNNSKYKLFERNSIGLRVSFPIDFKTNYYGKH